MDADNYLKKVRKLKGEFGPGLASVYCWFYSTPQRWTRIEPEIFKLKEHTDSFDLENVSKISEIRLARLLKSLVFSNAISKQLKSYCKSIQDEYGSWAGFAQALENEDIFSIFNKLRRHHDIRLTFKNLAAMKSFVGFSDDFLILDTHVAKVLGITKESRNRYVVQDELFKGLLGFSEKITDLLKLEGWRKMTTIEWSLAIWFNKAGIHAGDLLTRFSTR